MVSKLINTKKQTKKKGATYLEIYNNNFTPTTKCFQRQVARWSYLQTALRFIYHMKNIAKQYIFERYEKLIMHD